MGDWQTHTFWFPPALHFLLNGYGVKALFFPHFKMNENLADSILVGVAEIPIGQSMSFS
jgi:hypothetical protein